MISGYDYDYDYACVYVLYVYVCVCLRMCACAYVYLFVCMHVTLDTICLPHPIPEPLFTLFLPFRSRDLPPEEGGVGEKPGPAGTQRVCLLSPSTSPCVPAD